jgi:hypothetical protein
MGPRIRDARHLGRPHLRPYRRAAGSNRRRGSRRARTHARAASLSGHGPQPQGRPRRLGARRPRGHASRRRTPGVGHLGVTLGRHRRRARHRLLRVARHLRVRPEGQPDLAERSRRQDDVATSSERAALPPSTATRSSSSGITRANRSSSRSTSCATFAATGPRPQAPGPDVFTRSNSRPVGATIRAAVAA